jgi:HAD superfamily hydrolase (TIGR01509 family)
MTIRAVFFDMGGTIQTFWHSPDLGLQATPGLKKQLLAGGIDLHLDNQQLYAVVSNGLERYRQWSLQSLEELSPHQVWREFIFNEYPVELNQLDLIAEALMLTIETRFYHREMRPEIPAVLDTIQKMGLKIGLISNVCSRGQVPANLEEYGLRDYFDPIVLSSEYGRRKPDPAIFHHAARLAQVPTSQCVYVGDRISRDIFGARRAGFKLAIQIRHDFMSNEEDYEAVPDAIIDQMTEIIDILRVEINQKPTVSESGPIQAIVFDAGDVLYFRPHRGNKLNAFLEELALDVRENNSVQKNVIIQQAYNGQIDQDQYREAIIRSYGVVQPDQVERGKQILEEEDNDVQFFKGVRKTLLDLKDRGYLLGIVTDTANPIHAKLNWFEQGGFGHVWDSIISSKELGVRKPDPAIYRAALQQLGLRAEQVVFVGHKASELEGARAVGMKTIAFNHDDGVHADDTIENFFDLLNSPMVMFPHPIEKSRVFNGSDQSDSI